MSATDHTDSRQISKLEMAHVLFMDIVGYSKLPMDHQEAVLHSLQVVVSTTSEFLRAQSSNEIIRLPTGDGMALVFFEDAEAAARCALEVGRALKSHPEVPLRMGLHSGPVYRVTDINANQNVAGGGINIAQRVMDCGDAGHILASQSVADVLGQLSSWKDCLDDLGEAEVKHGVRVHLYNLYTNEIGNRALPKKVAASKPAAEAGLRLAQKSAGLRRGVATGAAILVIGLVASGWLFLSRKAHTLTDKDTIVLADFTNTTGDPIFDDTLKTALTVSLRQSPFLNVLSDGTVAKTLQQMARPTSTKLTPEVARELCQRAGSKAYLAGSIGSLGSEYVLGLKAVNCQSGDTLAEEQVTAASKEKVLEALSKAASKLRGELGESLATVQKFDVPLYHATTNSLEALKAFDRGLKTEHEEGSAEAILFFKRAIELDPNFAAAYTALGVSEYNLNQPGLGADYLKKAFDLRDRVTERENFGITAVYYTYATGDLEKAIQTYELWIQVYTRDSTAYGNLGVNYAILGKYEKAATETREALRLEPNFVALYENLGQIYLALNRFDEARTTTEEALARKLDGIPLHLNLYVLAFIQGNLAAMKQQKDWAIGKPGAEDQMLSLESDTEAWSGRLGKARELSRQAVETARRSDETEPAALWQANAAIREALFGNADAARQNAAAAVGLAPGSRDGAAQAALAYALAGAAAHAHSIADDLGKRFPQDTVVQSVWLPTIRAQIETSRKNASRSVELLQTAAPYELGISASANSCVYTVHVRGMAYLSAHQGREAAAEFQKILDHRGLLCNCATGPLARLGLARAYALQGDTAKAKAAYQNFLTLWKDADPDIPILIAAKAEYARLK
jgi:tetratricopeptide (TPR) repeat protein/class 3 adenylate cyclase